MDGAPAAVNDAAHVLYWWVQDKVAHNPQAATFMRRVINRQANARAEGRE